MCLVGSGFLCATMLILGVAVLAPFSAIAGICDLIAVTSGVVFIGLLNAGRNRPSSGGSPSPDWFPDASRSHFSRAFRDAYGTNPRNFRKTISVPELDAPRALRGSRERLGLEPEPE